MLTITPDAEQALDAVVASETAPEGAGLRICQRVGTDGQPAIGLSVALAPEAGDEVVEEAKVPVFLAPDVVPLLDDKVLDARVDGDQVTFRIAEQAG